MPMSTKIFNAVFLNPNYVFLPKLNEEEPRIFASESIQVSTNTKSETKLGIEHLNIASLPTMTLSLRMSISNLWVVTAMEEQN